MRFGVFNFILSISGIAKLDESRNGSRSAGGVEDVDDTGLRKGDDPSP